MKQTPENPINGIKTSGAGIKEHGLVSVARMLENQKV